MAEYCVDCSRLDLSEESWQSWKTSNDNGHIELKEPSSTSLVVLKGLSQSHVNVRSGDRYQVVSLVLSIAILYTMPRMLEM